MSRLETPLKPLMREVTTSASVTRMWNRIEAKARVRSRVPLRYTVALSAAVLLLVVGIVGIATRKPTLAATNSVDLGPLLHADGSSLRLVQAIESARTVALRDGSTLVLERGASIEPLEVSAAVVLLTQARGSVLYDIKPGGPRRWTIACGAATVEVIGTSFRVERTESLLRVEVIRGTVLVRGDRVPERIARLTAGMKLEVATPPSTPSVDPESPISRDLDPSARPPSTGGAPRAEGIGWRELARRGDNEKAYAQLGTAGVLRVARSASVDDLLALADVARLSGHPADAVAPLERVVAEHRADSRASLAAFTLGRVRLDSLHAPSAAVRAFETAIALGIPGGLEEDAYAHLAEACAKAGDGPGAKAAYAEYMKRFPNGSRRAELRRWVPEP